MHLALFQALAPFCLNTGLFPDAFDYFSRTALALGENRAVASLDGTDLHQDPRVLPKSGGYRLLGAEQAGDLGPCLGLADTPALEAQFKAHAVLLDAALESPNSVYPAAAAASLLAFVNEHKGELQAKLKAAEEKLVAMRVRYRGRNGEDTDELRGKQKTWVSMVRRLVAIALAGRDAGDKAICLLTLYVAPAAGAPSRAPEVDELMDLVEWLQAIVRALIKTAEHYMPIKLSTFSNFSVTVGRVYFKGITNRDLFTLLDKVGETLQVRSGGKVTVAVEAFDGEHRGRVQGGAQYYAHQGASADELVRRLLPGNDAPSALTKVGKAMRVQALAAYAIDLHLNGPRTTPKIAGIFAPPLAAAAAAPVSAPQTAAAAAAAVAAAVAAPF